MKPRQPFPSEPSGEPENGANSNRLQFKPGRCGGGSHIDLRHRTRRRFFRFKEIRCRLPPLNAKNVARNRQLDARYCCDLCFGPLEVAYDHSGLGDPAELRRKIQAGPNSIWRYSDFLPFERRPRVALEAGLHAAGALRAPGRAARSGGGVRQERRRQPDPLVQGSRRERGRRQGPRAGFRGGRLRIHRQPRQRGRGARLRRRARVLCLRPGRPRGAEDPRHRRLRDAPGSGQWQLRRRQPALYRALRRASVGVCERQPAPLLRRGFQDAGVRGGRAARLRAAGPSRVPDRVGLPVHQDRPRLPGVARPRAGRRAPCRRSMARRPRAAARWHRPTRPATRSAGRCGPRRSPSRSRSAIRPTACSRSTWRGAPVARSHRSPTRRSSRASGCSPRRPASSPRRPAASPRRCCASWPSAARSGPTTVSSLYITGEGLKTLDAVRDIVSTYDVEPSVASFTESVPVTTSV